MTCVLVVGCYRSGTSAVAGVLHHLGVFMGAEFNEANDGNLKGYFEDIEFVTLHYRLMYRYSPPESENFQQYKSLIESRDQSHSIWGVKDPRLCVVLNDHISLFKNPMIISVSRDPKDISAAIAKQIGYTDAETYLPLVEHYLSNRDSLLSKFEGPKMHINYDDVKKDKDLVSKIAEFVNLPVTEAAQNHLFQI